VNATPSRVGRGNVVTTHPAGAIVPGQLQPRQAADSSKEGRTLPKAPVLGWHSMVGSRSSAFGCIADLRHRSYTTSGRAALLAAIRQLDLPAGSVVLVPTYHCPTMVAPVLRAGMVPAYFPIGPDGLPLLDGIDATLASQARAMCVAQYFGLPQSLLAVHDWCHERGIALIEDCAHSYIGQAGERPIGHWGDYATASLSKFFPVPEAGLLASAYHPLKPLGLAAPGLKAQVKAVVDVIEFAQRYDRLPVLSHLLSPLFWLKNRRRPEGTPGDSQDLASPATDAHYMMTGCDMDRTDQAPCLSALALYGLLPLEPIVRQRRQNYEALANGLGRQPGASLLPLSPGSEAAPYVMPLWVAGGAPRADEVYARLRAAGMPVFRWDRIWPGTPSSPDDTGALWSRQLLQFLCHQDLLAPDIERVVSVTQHILQAV